MRTSFLPLFATILAATGTSALGQPTPAQFEKHVVEVRWFGECADLRETNTFTASSPAVTLTASTSGNCSASLGSASFSGTLTLQFPEMTPPGTNSVDHFVPVTPMQVTAALGGSWVVQPPTNRFTLTGSGRVSATSGCPDVTSTRGPPLNPGSFPISLSAVCNNPLLFLKENNETNLLYEIESSFEMTYRSTTSFRTPLAARVRVLSYYRLSPAQKKDAISLTAVLPSAGTELVQKAFTAFNADIPYTLSSRQRGDIVLQAFDEAGNLLASSEIVRVFAGNASLRQLEINPFELQFVTSVVLKALLIDADSSTILAQSSITYNVGPPRLLPFQLGFGTGPDFRPTTIPALFGKDERLEQQLNGLLVARVEVSESPTVRDLALTTSALLLDNFRPQFGTIDQRLPPGFAGEVFITTEALSRLPYELMKLQADNVTFQARLSSETGELLSELITIPAETISISAVRPPLNTPIILGSAKSFTFTLDLSTAFTAERILQGKAGVHIPDQVLFSHPIGSQPAKRLISLEQTVEIKLESAEQNPGEIQLLNDRFPKFATTDRLYFTLQDSVDIPAGSTPHISALKLKLTSVNSVARRITVTLHPESLEAIALSKPTGNSPQAFLQTKTAQLPGLPFQNFRGLNRVWEFNPVIPEDGFSATLALEYNPEDFPDDANFSESTMQILSWVPDAGRLVAHPTTIDPTNRTATTAITSLAQFYTLGVTGAPLPGFSFPLWRSGPNLLASAQFLNLGSHAAPVMLTAYRRSGVAVTGETNPVTTSLAPGLTSRRLVDLFALDRTEEGWVNGLSSRDFPASLLLQSANKSEALALPSPAIRLVFPDLRLDSATTTEVHIANSSRFNTPVTLELRDTNGLLVSTNQVELGPKARIGETIHTLFTNVAQPFAGYLIAKGTQRLIGMELLAGSRSVASLNGRPESASTRLYAPRFTTGTGYVSEVSLVNPTTNSATVTLRAVNDTGANIAAPISFSLTPGQQFRGNVAALFGLSSATTGGLICESTIAGLVGSLVLRDSTAANVFAAAFPMQDVADRNWALPCLPLPGAGFRELSVMNINPLAVNIAVKFFLPNATLVATTNLTLAQNARTTRDLGALLPPSGVQSNGYFLVEASLPVIVSGLTGEASGNTLSPLAAAPFILPIAAPPGSGQLQLTPSSLDFPTVTIGQSVFATLVVSNSGTGPLQIETFSLDNSLFNLVSPAAPLTLAAASARPMLLRFSPESTNRELGTLFISSDDRDKPAVRVALSGVGAPRPAPAPSLAITLSGNQVTLTWPADVADFVLETASDFSPGAVWTEVSNVVTAGGQKTATVTPTSRSAFYRLRR